jgi:Ca2+/Na+ antiporter
MNMPDSPVPPEARSLHEQNKREAFDGMRAYHTSEIEHKGHTVEVIKTLLTVVVSAYGGLIALILDGKATRCQGIESAIVFFIFVVIVVWIVLHYTNEKIDRDHSRYEDHRSEYLAERSLLQIESLFATGYKTIWPTREKDAPSGYSYSKRLNIALGSIVIAAALIGSILSIVASVNKLSQDFPQINDKNALHWRGL